MPISMSSKEALVRVARANAEMCLPEALQSCLRAVLTLLDQGVPAEEVYNAITAPDWQWEESDVQRPED